MHCAGHHRTACVPRVQHGILPVSVPRHVLVVVGAPDGPTITAQGVSQHCNSLTHRMALGSAFERGTAPSLHCKPGTLRPGHACAQACQLWDTHTTPALG